MPSSENPLENGIFHEWVKEAQVEVSNKGWRNCSMNALLLLCHAKTARVDYRIEKALRGPIKWFVGVCASGLVWLIVRDIFNI
jgi:hypothetical protein